MISPHLSRLRVVGIDFSLRTADVEAMQRHLTRLGLYADKVDGKAGDGRRAQRLVPTSKSAGLKVDCWPSEGVLHSMSAAR